MTHISLLGLRVLATKATIGSVEAPEREGIVDYDDGAPDVVVRFADGSAREAYRADVIVLDTDAYAARFASVAA